MGMRSDEAEIGKQERGGKAIENCGDFDDGRGGVSLTKGREMLPDYETQSLSSLPSVGEIAA
jgi:hypothetical protein